MTISSKEYAKYMYDTLRDVSEGVFPNGAKLPTWDELCGLDKDTLIVTVARMFPDGPPDPGKR